MQIKFTPVLSGNRQEIINLKVAVGQEDYIETTEQCLCEADALPLWRPVGIYIDKILIGFAMYGLWIDEGANGRVWLDRFMLDKNFQGKGLSAIVLKQLINHIWVEYSYSELFLSIYNNNKIAIKIYEKIGFEFNGETDINGELVMVLKKSDFIY